MYQTLSSNRASTISDWAALRAVDTVRTVSTARRHERLSDIKWTQRQYVFFVSLAIQGVVYNFIVHIRDISLAQRWEKRFFNLLQTEAIHQKARRIREKIMWGLGQTTKFS